MLSKKFTLIFTVVFFFIQADLIHASGLAPKSYSDIKPDETVVFFRTAAWLDEVKNIWQIPIHGWIYELEDSRVRKGIFEKILEEKYDLINTKQTEANFSRRINLLIADNERDKEIIISIGKKQYFLPKSEPNGQFQSTISVPLDVVNEIARDNLIRFEALTHPDETRVFSGQVKLVSPLGISIISDIDDTIKITNVTDHKALLENTFFKDFISVPGMAGLYNHWSKNSAAFHYVSSSPWQLYLPLKEFVDKFNFPWATFSLKMVRFRDKTVFNLIKKGTETKPAQIVPILKTYPKRQFILIGDNGEQDPEVYAKLMRQFPTQIIRAYIRNVNGSTDKDNRYKKVFAGIEKSRWRLFTDVTKLKLPAL